MQLILQGISKKFRQVSVLTEVSTVFQSGQVSAVTGPSGCGKSTLLTLISGLLRPDEGAVILVDGAEVVEPRPRDVVWVPQAYSLIPRRTLLENVAIAPLSDGLGREEALDVAAAALRTVSLGPLSGRTASALSGGEAQRVAVARALASKRSLVMADEPTASLDRRSAVGVGDALVALAGDRIVVIATHDPIVERLASTTLALG